MSAHSFRKLFETSFDLEGSLNVAKKVMGKAIPPSDEPYLQYEDELTKVYMDVYGKRLSLYRESTRIKDLEEKLAAFEAKENPELEVLQKQIDVLKELYLMSPIVNGERQPDPRKEPEKLKID